VHVLIAPKAKDEGLKAVKDILNAALKLLPHYNLRSSFILSLYSIPKPYAIKQYPKLFDEDVQAVLKKFGITLDEEPPKNGRKSN